MSTSLNLLLSGNELKVLSALSSLMNANAQTTHISTNLISEKSALSIYQTRYTLLKLEEKGIVAEVGSKPKQRKRWSISYQSKLAEIPFSHP